MVEIELTQGKKALIDDADEALINQHKWCAVSRGEGLGCIAVANVKRDGKYTVASMHRLLIGATPGSVVRHIDKNTLNNQKANLEVVAKQGIYPRKKAHGRFLGVMPYNARKTPWLAKVCKNGVSHRVGVFASEEEAARARDRKATELYGSDAILNFPAVGGRS